MKPIKSLRHYAGLLILALSIFTAFISVFVENGFAGASWRKDGFSYLGDNPHSAIFFNSMVALIGLVGLQFAYTFISFYNFSKVGLPAILFYISQLGVILVGAVPHDLNDDIHYYAAQVALWGYTSGIFLLGIFSQLYVLLPKIDQKYANFLQFLLGCLDFPNPDFEQKRKQMIYFPLKIWWSILSVMLIASFWALKRKLKGWIVPQSMFMAFVVVWIITISIDILKKTNVKK